MAEDFPQKMFLGDISKSKTTQNVWVQGTVQQTVGSDILILSDETGRAKVTQCSSADGAEAVNSVSLKDAYCCIIGSVVSTRGLPEIRASKLLRLCEAAARAWPSEVREASLILQGQITHQL